VSAGVVLEVRRHPVKSVEGEQLAACEVEARGLVGDRLWAVCDPDGRLGSGKSTRRFRRMDGLRQLVADYEGDVPVLTFPDGRRVRGDDDRVHEELSRHVQRPVRLQRESAIPHHDEGPLHLVTTASLRALGAAVGAPVDPLRLRANLLVDWPVSEPAFVEDHWVGEQLRVGELVLEVTMPMPRCAMVDAATRDLPVQSGILRTVTRVNDGSVGVLAHVLRPGVVRRGDRVERVGLPR